ncbi:MAG: hypothetical protein JWM36_3250 [Hyphomicrobiales bacterium]|nr:hypothetical protein [Hyphomicrobiales bacterium]
MATRTIETQAIISAKDRTGSIFAEVGHKLKALEKQSISMGKRTEAASRASLQQAARQVAHVSATPSFAKQMVMTSAAIAGSYAIKQVTARIIHQAAAEQHERMRMNVAGMSGSEIEKAQTVAEALQSKYKPIGQTNIMHMLRNARSVVGSFEEAQEIMEPLLKLRMVAQGAQPHAAVEEINEDFDKLVKGLEIKGVTQNLPKFKSYIEGMGKALNLFGDTLKPYEYYQMFKYGRASTQGLSEKYMMTVAPTLAQELGGSSAGKAQSAFYSAIIGGKMSNLAAGEFVKLGLVDPTQVVRTKTGSVKGIKPGGISGSELARTNPYEWVRQYLVPAMNTHGVTSEGKQAEMIAHLFGNAVAAQLVTLFTTQSSRIDKDAALIGHAKGADEGAKAAAQTYDMASKALVNSIDRLSTSLGRPFIDPLTRGINRLADGIDTYAARLDDAQRKQKNGDFTPSTGQQKFNMMMNKAAGGQMRGSAQSAFDPSVERAHQDMLARDYEDNLGTDIERTQKQIDELSSKPVNPFLGTRNDQGKIDKLKAQRDRLQKQHDAATENRNAMSSLIAAGAKGAQQLRDYNGLMMNQPAIEPSGHISKLAMPLSRGYAGVHGGMLGVDHPAVAGPAEQKQQLVSLDPNSKVDVHVAWEVKAGSPLIELVKTAQEAIAAGSARVSAAAGGVGKTGVGSPGSGD